MHYEPVEVIKKSKVLIQKNPEVIGWSSLEIFVLVFLV